LAFSTFKIEVNSLNNYLDRFDKTEVLKLLDKETILALLAIYGIRHKSLAARFHVSRPAISYLLKHDAFKPYQRELILNLLMDHGMELLELILVNRMVNTAKKVKKK
jgi:hypothetical protein